MNAELIRLERRAAKHAALSDPARLLIVDRLSAGDVSPSELQSALGMASNLLAHHLNVLEKEGLLRRSRSEADRRRTYLHLVPGALDDLVSNHIGGAARVVFVCTANSARSQLAAAMWRQASAIPATSAGTQPAARIDPRAIAAAGRHGLKLRRVRPRTVDQVVRPDDFIITVCDNAHERLGIRQDLHWSVADPVPAGTAAAFDAAVEELDRRVLAVAPQLTGTR
jgi:protein-tyrosine-phosphatase